ncbi:hypothetical protein KKC60_00545, partial [Patescibacteria group bacterium]|nr:hypothetical protein [Patescibacteria group bacterium]
MADRLKNKLPSLEDQKTLEQLKHFIDVFQLNGAVAQARDLADLILGLLGTSPNFSEKEPELFKKYQSILIRSHWIALPILTNSEVAEMFEKYFLEGLAMMPDIDLWDKLKAKLTGMLIYEERDKLKEKVRKALERSEQRITDNILIAETAKRDPTIANWILDFTANLRENMFDRVKENQYFVNSQNTKSLSDKEKEKLKILLDIYRRCGLSSLTTAGIEEGVTVDEEKRKGIIKEGQFEEIKSAEYDKVLQQIQKLMKQNLGVPPAEMSPEEVEKQRAMLMQQYLGPAEERQKIHQEEDRLETISQGDLSPVRQVLLEAINQ